MERLNSSRRRRPLSALLSRDMWWEQPPPCITTPYSFLVCTAVFSTLLSRSLMPKNRSAGFVTQKQNWKKKQKTSFIELTAIWLRNTTLWGEILAQLSLRKCVLSVPDWVWIWVCIAHLHSSLNTWSLIFSAGPPACLPHVVQMPPNLLLPTEHQKIQSDRV